MDIKTQSYLIISVHQYEYFTANGATKFTAISASEFSANGASKNLF